MVGLTRRSSRFSPAEWAARRGVHYGWIVVAVTFFVMLVAAGVRSAPSVLITPFKSDFGWSTSEISYALSLSLLTLGLAGPVSGRLSEKYGIRITTIVFGAIGATGVTASIFLQSIWQLHVAWGLLVGFGTGGMSIILSATVANAWFETRRGLVTGLLGGASSAGQFIFLQILIRLVDGPGWRWAVAGLAVLMFALVLPLVIFLMRSRPADLGLRPYGASGLANPAASEPITPVREALKTRDFWLLAISFGVCGFTTIGLIGTHFIAHATEHGFTQSQAAGILSIIGAMNIVGTIGSGWLTDRYSPRRLLALYYFLRALSLLALPLIDSVGLMSLFAVVFGLDYIATVPPTVMLTANRFGRRSVGSIYGWITFSHMAGGAIAAALAGQIHDVAGDYAIPIYLSGILALLAASLAFNVGSRKAAAPTAAQPATAAGY